MKKDKAFSPVYGIISIVWNKNCLLIEFKCLFIQSVCKGERKNHSAMKVDIFSNAVVSGILLDYFFTWQWIFKYSLSTEKKLRMIWPTVLLS